ncbi:MAG: hypothetical protein DWI24_06900 [Planctomycetota bacterium]|nr:MAG: hypothetical protein DWI24_06900 [Planctomycetota bacterium]
MTTNSFQKIRPQATPPNPNPTQSTTNPIVILDLTSKILFALNLHSFQAGFGYQYPSQGKALGLASRIG